MFEKLACFDVTHHMQSLFLFFFSAGPGIHQSCGHRTITVSHAILLSTPPAFCFYVLYMKWTKVERIHLLGAINICTETSPQTVILSRGGTKGKFFMSKLHMFECVCVCVVLADNRIMFGFTLKFWIK